MRPHHWKTCRGCSTVGRAAALGLVCLALALHLMSWKMNKLQIFSKQRWMVEDGPMSFELCLSTQRAELRFAGKLLVSSPFDLFWSVGTDLVHGWPTTWHGPVLPQGLEVETTGDRLEARVEVEIAKSEGAWLLHDTWHFEQGTLHGTRSWTWQAAFGAGASPSVLSLRWLVEGHSDKLLMPGVLYYGNPAGAASQRSGWDSVVPEWRGAVVQERLQVEEHRLPQPWLDLQLDDYHVGLGSWPSMVGVKDLYWSMGAEVAAEGTLLQLLSGPVAMNGHDGMMKTGQRNCSALLDVALQLPPGGTQQKSYYLQVGPASESGAKGDGFRSLLNFALARANLDTSGLPCFTSILHSKVEYALRRWRESNGLPGFDMFGSSDRREIYAMGWAGQAEAPGYAFQVLASTLGRPELAQLGIRSLDVLAQAPFKANGFMLALNGSTGVWEEGVGRARMDLVSQGQAMGNFARAIAVGRSRGVNTSLWDAFHLKACEVHAARLEDDDWAPTSAQEAFLVLPLTLGASLHREPRFLEVALKAGNHFASTVKTLWGGTLDARCEDKEGLWAGFQAFLALYEATGDTSWLDAAERAADLLLTPGLLETLRNTGTFIGTNDG
ncbi:unnamed protein product [Cladocopium goreaui]|uniref:Uncharacterized protein n=1 Tax=Cladocopium goreaui TaxID=2562237 RepID=A0A9P1CVC7_9DINO|nr:unnamed protein product [Cladocopium goreaui]